MYSARKGQQNPFDLELHSFSQIREVHNRSLLELDVVANIIVSVDVTARIAVLRWLNISLRLEGTFNFALIKSNCSYFAFTVGTL